MSLLGLFIIFLLGNLSLASAIIAFFVTPSIFITSLSVLATCVFYLIFWAELMIKEFDDDDDSDEIYYIQDFHKKEKSESVMKLAS